MAATGRSGLDLILPGIGFLRGKGPGERPTISDFNRAVRHARRASAIDESRILVYRFEFVKRSSWTTSDETEGRAESSK
jgi:hypothetical protein